MAERRRRSALAACAPLALSILMLLPASAPAQTSSGSWTCKGVALRIGTSEFGVSNKPNNPCRTQKNWPVEVNQQLGPNAHVHAGAVASSTSARKDGGHFGNGVTAQAGVAALSTSLLGLKLGTGEVRSLGFVTCARDASSPTGLSPAFNGPDKNDVVGLWVGDRDNKIELAGKPFVLDLGIATLTLNNKVVRPAPNGGREMVLTPFELNSPLPAIVIGESRVGYTGNPCDRRS